MDNQRSIPYETFLDDVLQTDADALAYLNACLESDEPGSLQMALADLARARGVDAHMLTEQLIQPQMLYQLSIQTELPEAVRVNLLPLQHFLDRLGLKLKHQVQFTT